MNYPINLYRLLIIHVATFSNISDLLLFNRPQFSRNLMPAIPILFIQD